MNMALGTALTSGTKHKELWSDPNSLLLWISDERLQGSQTLLRHLHEKKCQ